MELKKRYENIVRTGSHKIKIVELTGRTLKRVLQKSDPFEKRNCEEEDCFVCSTHGKGHCRKSSITYKVKCLTENCGGIYNGESSRNGYSRGREELRDYKNHSTKSYLWKHCINKHESTEQQFKMDIEKAYRNDPML